MAKRRVVVTGLGIVSPLGNDVETAWKALLAGKSGVGPIEHFDASRLSTRICAAVKNFDPDPLLSAVEQRRLDGFVQYGLVAADQALKDAGLTEIDSEAAQRYGVAIGSGIGGLPGIEKNHEALLKAGPRRISPFFIPGSIINMVAGFVSIRYSLYGPNISIVSACSTGNHNIGHAARMITYGDADVMVAGGTERASTELGLGGFASMKALSRRNDEPERASRPWDKDRDGFVLGDGAGVMILEEYEHAQKRGAKIYAELIGFGMSADGYHLSAPEPEGKGLVCVMQNALDDAAINLEEVDYINAHGTSTPAGDEVETAAIKKVFGGHAFKLAISSTKSMTGHLLGAAGAVESIFSILALCDQVAPPTINLDNPYDGCDLDLVPHEAKPMPIKTVLNNSFGFGGTNGSLLFRKI